MNPIISLSRIRDLCWLTLLTLYIVAGINTAPFHGDESTTLWMSLDFDTIINQRDLVAVQYQDPPLNATEQALRLAAAPLTKYAFGIAWTLDGFTREDINNQWVWGADISYNAQNGHIPSDELLETARRASTLFLIGSMIVLFSIGRKLSTPIAYIATLYYTLNPAILLNGRRAMMEGTTLFFGLMVVLAGLWLLHNRNWTAAIILGLVAGLGVAAKHPNVVTVIAIFVVCGGYAVYQSLSEDEDIEPDELSPPTIGPSDPYNLITLLFVAGILALMVFFALNPVLWDDPATRIGNVVEERTIILDTQIRIYGGYETLTEQIEGFLRQVFIARPQYYEDPAWADYIPDQILSYEQSRWSGVSIGGSLIGGAFVLGMVIIGFVTLLRDNSIRRNTRWLIGVWGLAMFALTLLATPLEWQRYYLYAYPAVAIIGGLGLVTVIQSTIARLR